MADDSPDTVWVLVKHVHAPFPEDKVIGTYKTEGDAWNAYQQVIEHRQWFTEYTVERRLAGAVAGDVVMRTAVRP